MIIKILLIAAALGCALVVMRENAPGQRLALRRVLGVLVVFAGIVAIMWPSLTTTAANAIGVGRGTDLVLYMLVTVFAYTAVATSQRIHRLERDVTVLTRELALSQPERPVAPREAPESVHQT